MANESVPESTGAKTNQRCKHDVSMINEVDERMLKIKAIADLMLSSRSIDLAEDTVTNIGWLLIGMADEVRAIVNEKEEVAA